jgi:hypothetical protein
MPPSLVCLSIALYANNLFLSVIIFGTSDKSSGRAAKVPPGNHVLSMDKEGFYETTIE